MKCFAGMAAEKGKGAFDVGSSVGSSCCDSPMPGIEGAYKVVTSEELKAMLNSRTHGLVVIDARTPEEYQKAHIKDAISTPLEQLEKDATLLDAPKDAKLVFCCNGIKCGKGKKLAMIAIEPGYKDVSVYIDGMPVWEEKGYPSTRGRIIRKSEATKITIASELFN